MRNRHVRLAVWAALSSANALCISTVLAGDIGFDGSLPGTTAASLSSVNGTYAITQSQGFTNGTNLFHSFEVFNLDQGETAVFSGSAAITNVVSRVTGGIPTTIDGTVRSTINGANFFFVNPAGITVGPTGSIDVSGAVGLAAADYVVFADEQRLSATPDGSDVSLLVANPTSFGFLEQTTAGALIIQDGNFLAAVAPRPLIDPSGTSQMLYGASGVILQSNQDVNLRNTQIQTAVNGGILVESAGAVTIEASALRGGSGFDLGGPAAGLTIIGEGQITLRGSELHTFASLDGVSSDISIQGNAVQISGGDLSSSVDAASLATALGTPDAGNIAITALGGDIVVDGGARIRSDATLGTSQFEDGVLLSASDAGGIGLNAFAGAVQISGGSLLETSAGVTAGGAGAIDIAGQSIRIDGATVRTSVQSQLLLDPFDPSAPLPASISLQAFDSVAIHNAALNANTSGTVQAGSINVAGAAVLVDSDPGSTTLISSSSTGAAIGGDISIDAVDMLRIADSSISASAGADAGGAGSIHLSSSGSIAMSNTNLDTSNASVALAPIDPDFPGDPDFPDEPDFPGDLPIDLPGFFSSADIIIDAAGDLDVRSSQLTTQTTGTARAGAIFVSGANVGIRSTQITASTTLLGDLPGILQTGDAGDIGIDGGTVLLDGVQVRSSAVAPDQLTTLVGSAGSIGLSGNDLQIFNSVVESSSNGANAGNAGQLDINGANVLIDGTQFSISTNSQRVDVPTRPDASPLAALFLGAGQLELNNSSLTASSFGAVSAGAIALLGNGDDGTDATSVDFVMNNSQLRASAAGTGGAGLILVVNFGGDLLLNDSLVESSSENLLGGSAGTALLAATNIALSGSTVRTSAATLVTDNDGGGIISDQSLSLMAFDTLTLDHSTLEATTTGALDGGGIGLIGNNVFVRDSTLTAQSLGTGFVGPADMGEAPMANATFTPGAGGAVGVIIGMDGQIINPDFEVADAAAVGQIVIDRTDITTNAVAADGGGIVFDAIGGTLRLSDSRLVASAGGTGMGGDIRLLNAANASITNSSLQASADAASGGSISVGLARDMEEQPLLADAGPLRISGSTFGTSASGGAGGNIQLSGAGNQILVEDSSIVASAGGTGLGGDISFFDADSVQLTDTDVQAVAQDGSGGIISLQLVDAASGPLALTRSSITTNAMTANGGNILLDARGNAVALRGSSIVASAGGSGRGGNITIMNADTASFTDSQVQALADAGNGGTINIGLSPDATGALSMSNSTLTSNATAANGGNILIDAAGTNLTLSNSSIVASAGGAGMGGDITIMNAGAAMLQNSQVQALADAGSGGTISIGLTNGTSGQLLLDGSSVTSNARSADGGNISIDAGGHQVMLRTSSIVASAGGTGSGGDISIVNMGATTLQNTQIQALANGGAGGTISLVLAEGAVGPVAIQKSNITTNAVAASGGNIMLDAAGNGLLLRDSTILASAGATGTGGNVLINNAALTIMQRSQMLARADAGNGGTITVNLAPGSLFIKDAQSIINADSNSGNDGAIAINSPDTDLNPAVKPQDVRIASTPELSANACTAALESARSTFVRENRGGVSASPDSYLASVSSATSQKTASMATPETVRLALLAANTPVTEGCR